MPNTPNSMVVLDQFGNYPALLVAIFEFAPRKGQQPEPRHYGATDTPAPQTPSPFMRGVTGTDRKTQFGHSKFVHRWA